jgi:hypothetical protein
VSGSEWAGSARVLCWSWHSAVAGVMNWNLDGVNGRLRRSEFRRVLWTDLWLLLEGGIEVESSGFVAVNMATGVVLVPDSLDRSSV